MSMQPLPMLRTSFTGEVGKLLGGLPDVLLSNHQLRRHFLVLCGYREVRIHIQQYNNMLQVSGPPNTSPISTTVNCIKGNDTALRVLVLLQNLAGERKIGR